MVPPTDKFYEIAGNEIASKSVVVSLWARAFAEANGAENLAIAKYVKLRVLQLEVEWRAEKARPVPDPMVIVICPKCHQKESIAKLRVKDPVAYHSFEMMYNRYFGMLKLTCKSCQHRFKAAPYSLQP